MAATLEKMKELIHKPHTTGAVHTEERSVHGVDVTKPGAQLYAVLQTPSK